MPTKKLAGAAAFTAALAAGGAAGALFGTPVLSGAQESSDDSTSTTESTTEAAPTGEGRGAHKGESVTTAAEVLGMTAEELRAELQAGKSIADVAAEKGVDKQKVIDALVAAATARIDQMKAALPDRMADLVERDGPLGGPGGPGHHRGPGRGIVNSIDDAATALGISVQELRDELAAGKSIATIASEKGKSLDDVKAAMIADATARIDQAVADGKVPADRAAEMKANLAEKVDELVQREGLPMRGHHGPGRERPADAPADASTTA